MKNVLIISGHTNLAASVANKTILETLNERLPEAEIVKLDELYPDFKIAPSILERWMEETFRHGFSHGSTGDKLKGKKLVLSFTTGAPEALYSHKGAMGYTIDEFLACYKATCRLTHMEYSGSVYTCGISYGNRTTPELIEQQRNISVAHTERLIELLETL